MQTQIQVASQNLPRSDVLDAAIREEAAALERYFTDIVSCHVTVSEPHRHQHQGRLYRVRVHLTVPGDELVVDHEHDLHPGTRTRTSPSAKPFTRRGGSWRITSAGCGAT